MKILNNLFIKNYCEECFAEFTSDTFVNLRKSNKQYEILLKRKKQVLDNAPRLREILENQYSSELSKKEVKVLKKYLKLDDDSREMEEKEMFIRGMIEMYHLLKKFN